MKAFWLTLLLASSLPAAEPSLNLEQFTVPEFGAAGVLIRRLSAESAKGASSKPTLTKGRVEFLRDHEGHPEVVAHFDFDEAIYERSLGVIYGFGPVSFQSPEGSVSGKGFLFDPEKSELRLDAEVVVKWPAATVKAATGTLAFVQAAGAKKAFVVKTVVLAGGVNATELKAPKLQMERAEAERAAYSSADGLLRISSPVTYWRAGQKGRLETEEVQVQVGEIALPAESGKDAKAQAKTAP